MWQLKDITEGNNLKKHSKNCVKDIKEKKSHINAFNIKFV